MEVLMRANVGYFETIWNYVWNVGDFPSLHKKVYRHDLMFETLKTFASLRREVYWDDLEFCWNNGGL